MGLFDLEHGSEQAAALAAVVKGFYQRGWSLGTGGNYSVLLSRAPFRCLITASGVDKGALTHEDFLVIDEGGGILQGKGKPSAETGLHLAIYKTTSAGAVLHTHSVPCTALSMAASGSTYLSFSGMEMQKGLRGISSHETDVHFPILENSQNIPELSVVVAEKVASGELSHGFTLRGHGIYTWGQDLFEARRHVEIIEFLLETSLALKTLKSTNET